MGKFIRSTASLEFENPETGEKLRIPREYLGAVPAWVEKTPLFQLAIAGKNPVITGVGNDTERTVSPGVSEEEQELRAKAKALKIPRAAKLSLAELVLAIQAIEHPPQDEDPGVSEEVEALREKAASLGVENAGDLPLVDLVLAIQEKEKPPEQPDPEQKKDK